MQMFFKKPIGWFLILILILAVGWLVYISAGRALIKSAYKGDSLGFFNKLIVPSERYGLEFYYKKADDYLLFFSTIVLFTGIFALPVIYLLLSFKKMNERLSPKNLYLMVATALFIWIVCSAVFYQPAAHRYSSDYWEHSATIKEWSSNLWHPQNPHIAGETPSMRFMPYLFLLSIAAKTFHLTPIQALGLGAVLNAGVFLFGLFLFFKEYFRNDWAPILGLIILLSVWGLGYPWSNLYQLRSLFFVISYPSYFVFAWTLIFLWMALRVLRGEGFSILNYFILGILSPVLLLSHPHSAVFAFVSLFMLAVFEPGAQKKIRVLLIVSVVAGSLTVIFWPYFSLVKSFIHESEKTLDPARIFKPRHYFYEVKKFLLLMWPVLLGIPIIIHLIHKRKHPFINIGFMAMLLPYVLFILVYVPLGFRFMIYAAFFLHMAFLWALLRSLSGKDIFYRKSLITKYGREVLIGFIALSFGWNMTLAVLEFAGYHVGVYFTPPERFAAVQPIENDMTRIALYIPEDAVVLAPAELSWPLPTFSGKVVALHHYNPFVKDMFQRLHDTEVFFQGQTASANRIDILKRYNVTHVLYDKQDISESTIESLTRLGEDVGRIKSYRVVKILR